MIKSNDAYYIVGFVDGEGSFNISFIKRSDYKYNIKVSPSFNISQKDRKILEWIKNIFNCGTIRDRGDGVFLL
jgi:intein-encoded DNA endonuclease-like protein